MIQEACAMHNHVLLKVNYWAAPVGSKWPIDLLPSAGEKVFNAALQAGSCFFYFLFLLWFFNLFPPPHPHHPLAFFISPLSSPCDCDCVSPTFRVSPLMCCCSLALLNWHVRTFARVESQPKRTAAEIVVCYFFKISFYLPPLCHSCCLWFPSRCTSA